MKLGAIVTEYRHRLQISQREFARRCGLSNSYISFIENEYNPKTGKPIVPTLEQYQKIAAGMDMTVHHLFELLDEDSPVDLHTSPSRPADETDQARLEALHQDPRLCLLFDRTRKMSHADVEFMLQFADRILKEQGVDD